MDDKGWNIFDTILGVFTVIIICSMFNQWYSTGNSPLGWDTPKYIHNMLIIREKGVITFLKHTNYEYLTYSLLGGMFSILFHIDPYYIEIYFPILLCVLLAVSWYYVGRKWFEKRIVGTFTLFLTVSWYSLFDFPVFRHNNLLAYIFALFALSCIPTLYDQANLSKKYLFGVWSIFLAAGFTHPHTMFFFWFIVFLATIYLAFLKLLLNITIIGKIFDITREKYFLKRLLLFGSAVMIPLLIGLLFGEGTAMVYRSGLAKDPLPYFQSMQSELFLDFGGYLAIFLIFGIIITFRNLFRNFEVRETILLAWVVVPIILFLVSFRYHFLVLYARRSLLSLPLPIMGAVGISELFHNIETNIQLPSLMPKHFPAFIPSLFLLGMVITPMVLTEDRLYHELTPAKRYISEKTVKQLKWIRNQEESEEDPVFLIFTSVRWTAAMISAWDDWIRCYIRDFYIYPGIIKRLLALQSPRCRSWVAGVYYRKMKQDNIFSDQGLLNRSIYVLPEFYKHGYFGENESRYLTMVYDELYRLQINETLLGTHNL